MELERYWRDRRGMCGYGGGMASQLGGPGAGGRAVPALAAGGPGPPGASFTISPWVSASRAWQRGAILS